MDTSTHICCIILIFSIFLTCINTIETEKTTKNKFIFPTPQNYKNSNLHYQHSSYHLKAKPPAFAINNKLATSLSPLNNPRDCLSKNRIKSNTKISTAHQESELRNSYNNIVNDSKFQDTEASFYKIIQEKQLEKWIKNATLSTSTGVNPSELQEDISIESRLIPKGFDAPRPLKDSQAITSLSNSGWSKRQIDSWDSSRNKLYPFLTPTEIKRIDHWDHLLEIVQDDTAFLPFNSLNSSESKEPSEYMISRSKKHAMPSSPILSEKNTQQYFEWKTINRVGARSCRAIPTPQRKLEAWRHQDNLVQFYKISFNNKFLENPIDKRDLEKYFIDSSQSILVIRDGVVDINLSKNINFDQSEDSNYFCGSVSAISNLEDRYKINEQLYWIPEYSNQHKVNTQPFHRAQIGYTSRKYDNDIPVYDYRKFDFGMAKLTALNQAGLKDSAVVIIKPNTEIQRPIQIIELSTQSKKSLVDDLSFKEFNHPLVNPRLIIWVKEASSATIQQTFVNLSDNNITTTNSVTRIIIDNNSRLNHHYIQELNGKSWHWENIGISNNKNSFYDFKSLQLGALSSRINMQIEGGEGSNQQSISLGLPYENQRMAMYQMFHHEHQNMSTSQKYKFLLAGKGRGLWRGRVRIEREGVGAKANTLCRAIMLNQGVQCMTIPTLEIIPKDVKQASHGAAISDLEEEPIFFLKTRGIDESSARFMLMKAFTEEITDDFKDPKLKQRIISKLKRMVPGWQQQNSSLK